MNNYKPVRELFHRSLKRSFLILRLVALFLIIGNIQVLADETYSQKTRLSLSFSETELVRVLDKIEEESEFFFLYNEKLLDTNRKVSINAKNQLVNAVLDRLFSGTDVKYTIIDRKIILAPEYLNEEPEFLDKRVTGKVVDENGSSLPGVNIRVDGTTNIGTTTDANGDYTIEVPGENSVLIFSFVGYTSQQISVAGKSVINVTLVPDVAVLEQVVVVAFGTVKKKDLTGSISSLDPKLVAAQSNSTLTRALEGSVAGLQISSIDGQPGVDMGIRIRGLGTASQNNSNALIVIDGVPSSQSNVLSILNPKDIEAVTILKDGASTSLWGSRGANGVVMVTTKKGKSGKAKITYDGRLGVNQQGPFDYEKIREPQDLYEYAWLSIYNAARYKSTTKYTTNVQTPNMTHDEAALFASQHLFDYTGSTTSFERNALGNWMLYSVPGATYVPTGSGSKASSTMKDAYLVGLDGKLNPAASLLYHDSYDDYFLENKFRQEHNLAISGASERIDYYMSLGYLGDPSYIRGSKFDRYNFRSNVNAKITDWLKAGINAAYANRATQSPATRYGRNPGSGVANVFRWTNGQNQLVPLWAHNLDGTYQLDADGNKIVHTKDGQTPSPLGPTSPPLTTADLTYILDHDKDLRISNDLNLRGYLEAKFLNDFTFNVSLSTDNSFEMRTRYWNPISGDATGYDGALGKTYAEINVFNSQQILNWTRSFGKHYFDAMAGHEFNSYRDFNMSYKGAYSLIPDFATFANFVGLNTGSTFAGTGGGENRVALEGYFSRVNYIYNNKYYLQASVRRDGSSKFKYNENRWGTFWSIGGGWRISGESWMSDVKWIDDLKLRGSYGVIGNQNGISNYSGYQIWGLGASSYNYSGASYYPAGYTLSKGNFVNDALTWEKVHTIDVGLDFRLGNRFFGTFDYYVRNTHDMVWSQPIAYSLGQTALERNTAKLRNRGVEVELGIDLIKTPDFQWSFSVNGAHYRTVLMEVPEGTGTAALDGGWTASIDGWAVSGGGASGVAYLRAVGKDYYNLYFYKYGGVDQTTGLPLFFHQVTDADHTGGLYADTEVGGDIKTTDYSQASRYEFGSATPDFIGGFSTFFHFRNFDFNATFAGQVGGKFLSVEYANGLYRNENISTVLSSELIGNTWTTDNTDAYFPMQMYTGDQYGNGATIGSWAYTDMSLFDASYLSVKSLVVGYTLPKRLLNKIAVSEVRLYASADNMWILTQHAGFDPRMSLAGGLEVGAYAYPYMRTMSLGVTVTF
jgi:TonB-linked SusC/RagA family outer membrane protein